jgi:ribonuclease D
MREVLGVELAKSHARADWMRRPLPTKQLQYAADDVIYLAKAYPKMRDKLKSLGRLDWLDAEWRDMTDPERYEKPAQLMWKRVKQINNLKGARLAVAQQLAAWREETAREANTPRNWLLKDPLILDLARQMPDDIDELKHVRGLSAGTIRQHGKAIIALIADAKNDKPQPLATPIRKGGLTVEQDAAADVLEAVSKLHAAKLAINAAVLAPRRSIEDLIRGQHDTTVMQGWRQELIGAPLLRVLQGDTGVAVVDGELQIQQRTGSA